MSVAAVTIAIFQTLLDWLSIAIILVFLYMIFSLATNGEGLSALGNLFRGGGDGSPRSSRDRGSRSHDRGDRGGTGGGGSGEGDGGDDGESDDDGETGGGWTRDDEPGTIDFANLGQIRFLVRNLHDEPLANAQVTLYPASMKEKDAKKAGVHYQGPTNNDGIFPPHGGYLDTPSGRYHYRVTYELSKNERYKSTKRRSWKRLWLNNPRKFSHENNVIVKPGEATNEAVTLSCVGEPKEGFEPAISNIQFTNDSVKYQGKVKLL